MATLYVALSLNSPTFKLTQATFNELWINMNTRKAMKFDSNYLSIHHFTKIL